MTDLPESWAMAPLGSLLSAIVGGGTPSKANADHFRGSIPFMTVKDMHARFIEDTQDHITEAALADSASTLIPADTLIVASRMSLGKVARPSVPVAINQDLKALFLHQGVNKAYVEYLWRANEVRIRDMGTGTTVKGIRLEDIRGLEVPIAPSNEQTRIADQLDTLLARVNACNGHLDAIPGILKRFRRAVLEFASYGKLTSEWRMINQVKSGVARRETLERLEQRRAAYGAKKKFKEPASPDLTYWRTQLPDSWAVESVSTFAECLDHLRVPVSKAKRAVTQGLYPYYGANGQVDLVDDYLFDDELVLVTEDETFYGREKPIAYRSSGRCWVNNHAHVLRAGDRSRTDYLCFALMYYDVEPWLTGTTGRAKLTQGALNSLPIAVPPQAEIEEIVRQVNQFFQFADEIEERLARMQSRTQRLAPQVLAKAFRGELVQQDPQDEPASVLLQRLAASPPVKAPASRGRPRATPLAQPDPPAIKPSDWATLPSGEWVAPADHQGQATTVCLTAVLRAWGQPMPERDARLATLLCQQPRLFTTVLPAAQAKQWSRLVGDDAKALPAKVARIQPAANHHWGQAIKRMRASGDLVESGRSDNATWALGSGAVGITTTGWPDGRAAFVVAHLRAHGIASVLPALEPAALEFVNVRAA